jgi:hypothetical protein
LNKYENATKICDSMITNAYRKRPNCDEILSEKQDWALTELKLNDEDCNKIKNIMKIKIQKGFSIYHIIKAKLFDK